ncbi:MAG: HAD family phosphatase [Actinomycetota bacterium]|nr:HAD family phosphatase [Actinomycetota bacterium]MEC9059429.1 HAD family phosphatase [Actinomycetota bacterium]MEE2680586.1 HAD family phosphatase [Actinomycetota bacterium]
MIEAILFDFDGVIRQWDESDLGTFEAQANIKAGTVFATAFCKELHEPLTRGELNWDQWRHETERRLTHTHGESIRPIVRRFFEFEGRIDADMITLVQRIPKSLRVGILTNNHDRFEDYLRRVGIEELFDEVINTHRIGVAKPDPLAYRHALAELAVEPDACLFIDDLATNVEGAEAIGLRAHHFQDRAGLVIFLQELGIDLISS